MVRLKNLLLFFICFSSTSCGLIESFFEPHDLLSRFKKPGTLATITPPLQGNSLIPVVQFVLPTNQANVPTNFGIYGSVDNCYPITGVYLSVDEGAFSAVNGGKDWWTNLVQTPGLFTIDAYATDNTGKSSLTNRISLFANGSLPTIQVTSHTNGQDCLTNITISGNAAASVGTIAEVYASVDGAPFSVVSGTASWNFSPDINAGPHTFCFYALDSLSNTSSPAFLKLEPKSTKYAAALSKAIQFYDANKCGSDVTTDNSFSWRGNCHTSDAVVGGFHDGGDFVKFSIPLAYSFMVLGWALYDHGTAFSTSDKNKLLNDIEFRFSNYFLTCYNKTAHTFIYQIGQGASDHSYWGPPETQPTARPSYPINIAAGYTGPGGLLAAGLALMSMNYQSVDSLYASQCLDSATNLYFDIKAYPYNSEPDPGFYDPVELSDRLAISAAFLYFADPSRKNMYYTDLIQYLSGTNTYGQQKAQNEWAFSWGDTYVGAFILAHRIAVLENDLPNITAFSNAVAYHFNYWINTVPLSAGGIKIINSFNPLRYTSGFCSLAFATKGQLTDIPTRSLAQSQLDYILGQNPRNSSYIIGYGTNYPLQPHHRAANPLQGNALYTLTGALVNGPDINDNFIDSYQQYQHTDVGIDRNANLIMSLSGLIHNQ